MKTFKDIREEKFKLVDMDDATAANAQKLAKKAGLKAVVKKTKTGKDVTVVGPNKKVAKFIMSLPEQVEVDEALVASDSNILQAIFNKLEPYFYAGLQKGDEKVIAQLNQVAKLVNTGVTKSGQSRNKTFMYKLKRK